MFASVVISVVYGAVADAGSLLDKTARVTVVGATVDDKCEHNLGVIAIFYNSYQCLCLVTSVVPHYKAFRSTK